MKQKRSLNWLKPLPFLLPFLLVYLVFTVYPIAKGLQMSLFDWTLIEKKGFRGFDHYARLLEDPDFWSSLGNTMLFVILSTPTMILLALGLALLANIQTTLQSIFRGAFFIPSILSVSVISYLAIFMLQPYTGFVNNAIQMFGTDAEPFWLNNPTLAWLSIVAVTLWWTVGFNLILFLTALQDIPDQLYEAAEIDGATRTQMFFKITLPQLVPIARVVLLLQVLASFKVFAQILLITDGGPGTATRPLIQYIYEIGFVRFDLGYASAMSYALFFLLLLLSIAQIRGRGKEGSMI